MSHRRLFNSSTSLLQRAFTAEGPNEDEGPYERSKVADSLVRRSFSAVARTESFRRGRKPTETGDGSLKYRSLPLDPTFLVRSQPSQVGGIVYIKRGPAPRAWDKSFAELRGCTIVFAVDSLKVPATRELRNSSAQKVPVHALVNILGCKVISGRNNTLKLKKPKSSVNVLLRFETALECVEWEHFLEEAASQRYVTLADFKIISTLPSTDPGRGLYTVRDRFSGDLLEMKIIDKKQVFESAHNLQRVLDERLAYELCEGKPLIRQMRYAFQGPGKLYLLFEHCRGGNLSDLLTLHSQMRENQARRLAAELVVAIEYLQTQGIIHRRVRPASIFLDRDYHVRLGNFGDCCVLRDPSASTTEVIDTDCYAAPEILALENYGLPADIWALGVLLFRIIHGSEPANASQLLSDIASCGSLSEESKSLVAALVARVPEVRLGCGIRGVADIKSHPFFQDVNWNGVQRCESHRDGLAAYSLGSCDSQSIDGSNLSGTTATSVDLAIADEELTDKGNDIFSDIALWPVTRYDRHVVEDGIAVGWFFSRGRAASTVR